MKSSPKQVNIKLIIGALISLVIPFISTACTSGPSSPAANTPMPSVSSPATARTSEPPLSLTAESLPHPFLHRQHRL
jgi:hypothetical protein